MPQQDWLDKIVNWDSYIDRSISEEDNFLFQMNHDNSSDYTFDEIEISKPISLGNVDVDITSPNNPIDTNTKVVVRAKPNTKYRGSDDYVYRRLDLVVQWKVLHGEYRVHIPAQYDDNEKIKRFLQRKMPFRYDSVTVEKVINPHGTDYIEVRANKGSYLYVNKLILEIIGSEKVKGPIRKIKDALIHIDGLNGLDYITNYKVVKLRGIDYITDVDKQIKYKTINGLDYITDISKPVNPVINVDGLDYITAISMGTVIADGVHYGGKNQDMIIANGFKVPRNYRPLLFKGFEYKKP